MHEADDSAKTAANPLADPYVDLCLHKFKLRLQHCALNNFQSCCASIQLFFNPIRGMAPGRTKKVRSSTEIGSTARPQTVTLQSPARTPVQSPEKRSMTITQGQKQALIDNLQLESEYSWSHSVTRALTFSQSRNVHENSELNTLSKHKVYGLASNCE